MRSVPVRARRGAHVPGLRLALGRERSPPWKGDQRQRDDHPRGDPTSRNSHSPLSHHPLRRRRLPLRLGRYLQFVIPRYTRPEMGAVWSDQARMEAWRRVEVAACEAMEGPSPEELDAIRGATFTVEAVNEREKVTDHDMAAFVDVLAESAGRAGRWIHFGLTSSDVLDTALALQIATAGEIVLSGARDLRAALVERAREHRDTLCVGRTHGVHAEPTTFGVKLAGFAFEADRNVRRLDRAFAQAAVGAVSGAVGTYASTSPDFEARVLGRLGLAGEDVSTPVVARDRL